MADLGTGCTCTGAVGGLVSDGSLVPDCGRRRVRNDSIVSRRWRRIFGCPWARPLGARVLAGRIGMPDLGAGCTCTGTVDGLVSDGSLVPYCGRGHTQNGSVASRRWCRIVGWQLARALGVRVLAGRIGMPDLGADCLRARAVDGLVSDGWLVPDYGRRHARNDSVASRRWRGIVGWQWARALGVRVLAVRIEKPDRSAGGRCVGTADGSGPVALRHLRRRCFAHCRAQVGLALYGSSRICRRGPRASWQPAPRSAFADHPRAG